MLSRTICTLVGLLVALPALASDGVLEINQTCAVQTGCFAGDTAGFPVTLPASGSYRLTGNLVVSSADTTAIQTFASDTTVDLNGFAISGPTSCTGAPSAGSFSCTPTGSGIGVDGSLGLAVRNGTIEGMGGGGVDGSRAHVEGLQLRELGGLAISAPGGSLVRGNVIRECAGGISAGFGVVSQNVISVVGGDGIAGASVAVRNSIINVDGDGIDQFRGIVRENEVSFANGFGLLADGTDVAYQGNVFEVNNGGNASPQVSGGVQTGINVCASDTVCP